MAWKDSLEENNIEESGGKGSGAAKYSKRSIMPTLLIGLWLVALTVLLVFLFIKAPPKLTDIKPGNIVTKKVPSPDAGGVPDTKVAEAMGKMNDLDKKVGLVETYIKNLENNIGERIAQIEKQSKDFEMLAERVGKLEATVLAAEKAPEPGKLPKKVTEAVKPEPVSPDDTTATVKEPSKTKPSVSEEPPKESVLVAASEHTGKRGKTANIAAKKRVLQSPKANAKKRTASAKVVKKRKAVRAISTWVYRDPVEREAAAAAYWLKRNRPDYSPESENEAVYEKRTMAQEYSSDSQQRRNELPVETVSDFSSKRTGSSSSGFQPTETSTGASLPYAERSQQAASSQIPGVKYYHIREGESIDDIGKRYNLSSKEIKRMNISTRGSSSFQPGEQIMVMPDGGFDHIGPRASLNQMSRKYDSLYGMSEDELNNIGRLAPGLGVYADWDLY